MGKGQDQERGEQPPAMSEPGGPGAGVSAAMMFLLVFAAAWLMVTGTAIAHFIRPRGIRRDISLLARAGLVIWFTGVMAAMFAEVRHWPAGQISQMQGLGVRCKLAGFAVLLVAGLARRVVILLSLTAAG
jgi:hypothetical protein